MNIEEKRRALTNMCDCCVGCEGCTIALRADVHCGFAGMTEEEINRVYAIAFPNTDITPIIKDSGERREFDTGAVRDIQEGKGRCDLMPLDVVAHYLTGDDTIRLINEFWQTGDADWLYVALAKLDWDDPYTIILEVAKHFEAGARKYGEYNWQKGIPVHCYIDSAVRHYLKHLRGDTDEPHDRAFVWNVLCCIWTCKHKPELIDLPFVQNNKESEE